MVNLYRRISSLRINSATKWIRSVNSLASRLWTQLISWTDTLGFYRDLSGVLILVIGMVTIGMFRWVTLSNSDIPPGSDGGQWLAFAHQMFSNEKIKAGVDQYPPIFPLVLSLISNWMPAMLSLKLLGIASSLLIAIPAYLLMRITLHPLAAATLAIVLPVAPYHSEVFSFGGYPQLAGSAFLLLSLYMAIQGLRTVNNAWLLGAAASTVLTVSTHALGTLQLVVTAAIIISFTASRLRPHGISHLLRGTSRVIVWWFIPATLLSLPFLDIYRLYIFAEPGLRVPLSEFLAWVNTSWRWEGILWALSGVASIPAIIITLAKQRSPITSWVATGLLVNALIGVFVIRELRFLHVLEISLVLWLGITLTLLANIPVIRARKITQIVATSSIIAVIFVSITITGLQRSIIAKNWYLILDEPVVEGLEWLKEHGNPTNKVVSTSAPRGHNYGWWIEGYAHLPTYVAGNSSLFFDPEERKQVAFAERLLSKETSPDEIRAMADEQGIKYLFIDRRMTDRPVRELASSRTGFVPKMDNGVILILERHPNL